MANSSDPLIQHLEYMRARDLSEATVEQRRRHVQRFIRRVGCSPLEATPEQCLAWFNNLTCQSSSRSVELSHIRSFCQWAVRWDLIPTDPTSRLDAPRRRRNLPRPIDGVLLDRLLRTAQDDPRLYAMLALAAYGGLRCVEISRLRWEDVTDTSLLLHGKGNRDRLVPVHPRVREALRQLPRDGMYVIGRCDGWRDRPLHPGRVSGLINDWLHEHGTSSTAHSLRHLYGTVFYDLSKDLRLTQTVMGHESPTTTAIYTQIDIGAAAEIVAQMV